jgi:hypothetical protein
MESIGLYLAAAALLAAGCSATVLSAFLFPLRIRVRGQAHGRFAALSEADLRPYDGSRGKPRRLQTEAVGQALADLIVA